MDKTINKFMAVLVFMVIFDSMSFSMNIEKTQYNLISSLINTGKKMVQIVKTVK